MNMKNDCAPNSCLVQNIIHANLFHVPFYYFFALKINIKDIYKYVVM